MASVQILNNSFSNTQNTLKQVVHSNNNLRIVVGLLVVALMAVLVSMAFLVLSSINRPNELSGLKSNIGVSKTANIQK